MIHHPCGRTTRHRTAAIQAVHNATSRHGSRAKRPTRPAPAPADFPHPWWQSPGVTSRHDGVSCCCVSRRRAGVARTCTPGGVRCVRAAGVPSPTWWRLVRAWGNPAGGGVLIHHECGVGLCVHTPGGGVRDADGVWRPVCGSCTSLVGEVTTVGDHDAGRRPANTLPARSSILSQGWCGPAPDARHLPAHPPGHHAAHRRTMQRIVHTTEHTAHTPHAASPQRGRALVMRPAPACRSGRGGAGYRRAPLAAARVLGVVTRWSGGCGWWRCPRWC